MTNGTEVRMNGSCAGGTGAFIDQMATLLKMSAERMMNKAAEQAQRTLYHRQPCSVFAKSDAAADQSGCPHRGYRRQHL